HQRALPLHQAACNAVAKAVREVRLLRDRTKEIRSHARLQKNKDWENLTTDTWLRTEDRLSDMIRLLREMVEQGAKEAARHVDRKTGEAYWRYGEILDPYGIDPEMPGECRCLGRNYFARSPGSNTWVSFYDLPEATTKVLWERLERG